MDFDKIKLETLKLCKYKNDNQDESDPIEKLFNQIVEISADVSKTMLEKYHQELNKPK